MDNKISIAIDGPSGAGKSTIAMAVAKEFEFIYVDTGAIYRSVGLYVRNCGLDPQSEEAVKPVLKDIEVTLSYDDLGEQHTFLNGEDVSTQIRLHEISRYASDVSAHGSVRAFLLDMQRDMAKKYNVIMDGRDIGTVVLPDAGLKIFLTADDEQRAKRRFIELKEKGQEQDFKKVLADLRARDKNDSSRANAPLMAAPDAVTLDTTELSLSESIDAVISLTKERFNL